MSEAHLETEQSAVQAQAQAQAQVFGQHVIVEYYGCNPAILNDLSALSDMLVEAAKRSGATPVKREFHQFAPHGISGVVIITESHLTIHTWPEHGYAAVDFFTCGERTDPLRAHDYLTRELSATRAHHLTLRRGIRSQPGAVSGPGEGSLWRARTDFAGELRAVRAAPDTMSDATDLWLYDDQGDQVAACRVQKVVHAGRTAHAFAEIVDTSTFGRMLVLDGMAMSAAADEATYHEALVAPPFLFAPGPVRRVAILGGGEGATLREVLRFPEVERCVMVDIDGELVELCRRHLPSWSAGAFTDPRAEVRIEDAYRFLADAAEHGECFDLILGDLPEAETTGPLAALYSPAFFALIKRCLSVDGIYCGQIGSLQMPDNVLGPQAILATGRATFGSITAYSRFIPSFGGDWVFGIASRATGDSGLPWLAPAAVDQRLLQRRAPAHPCRTYDGLTHQHAFSLPMDTRAALFPASEKAAK